VKRWLELDDQILCSYKSSDKPKLLNAVNLKKVRHRHTCSSSVFVNPRSHATDRPGQVSEVAMVPQHVDHNEKKSKMMWHIKLQDTPCVHKPAPLSSFSRLLSLFPRLLA
jgi:hypothetical protein